MLRRCSTMLVLGVAILVAGTAWAQDQKEGKKRQHQTPEQRFDALEKAAKHDPLKGELTKDEFVTAVKEVTPRMASHAEEFFKNAKKADEGKITKDEYVKAWKELRAKFAKKKDDDKKPQ